MASSSAEIELAFAPPLPLPFSSQRSSTPFSLHLMPPRRRAAPSPTPDSSSFLSDPELAHLSSTQKERLDEAFDRAGESKAERELGRRRDKKRRRVEEPQPETEPQAEEEDDGGGGGGGFILDDDDDMGGGFLPEGVDDNEDTGGGFMVDDDEEGGGFLPEAEPTSDPPQQDVDMSPPPPPPSTRSYLPLSLIPAALALAHLPPADSGVLDFFKQSAQGWEGARSIDGEEGGPKEKGVSRRDWFAVCAILLSGREEEMEGEEGEQGSEEEEQVVGAEEDDEDEEEEEDVLDPEDVEEEDEDDEDGGFVRSRPSKNRVVDEDDVEFDIGNSSRRRTRRTTRSNNVDDDDDNAHSLSPVPSLPSSPSGSSASSSGPRKKNTKKSKAAAKPKKKPKASNGWEDEEELVLSRAEKKHAKETFELLLGTEGVRKGKQVLEIKDVGAAVKTLKEGWSLEEVKEMVSMFSTAPDKASLTLKDLERLMWEGGLFP